MKITYHGHSTFSVFINGINIMFDPFITGNSLVTNKDLSRFNPEWILLTHGHADHVADVEAIAKANSSKIISNYEIVNWFGEKGVQGHPLNHGGKKEFSFGTTKYVNAVHTSSMPDGSYGGNPGGYVIWGDGYSLYFAGDTALTMDMKLIPMTCPKLTVAFLPIGDNFTMGYEDAVIAAEMIECDLIIGCHYDTFGYITIDKQKAIQAFADKGKELKLLEIEETIEL